ncbi:nitroreductase family deazaflavin-dependent oxidoreductase [Actinocrinis puniceicyclus]|uniref:Nitroreductase family deazaflavin-dependent oxidoreductase n=1 Tax=Actinocrinis puniceicyclus TaxID=977794 RepID=A0A8J8BDM5_9ACTN|nr:nitroreductase family deazaflavin-dependent oxidoreductase [Actinocrinis puniceicyclus]MBS2964630.1 nitroreductase family deazaflavin-dependent oxidoreductase [Actinocrinis puniceicyclus]
MADAAKGSTEEGSAEENRADKGSVDNGSPDKSVHKRPGPVARALLRAPGRLYDLHAGWLLDHRFIRLTHLGRRSGRRYRTMLEVVATDPSRDEVYVMAGLGERADWYRNLRAGGAVEVAIGRRRYAPVYRVLGEQEAADVLTRYEHDHPLAAPAVRRALTWLVGWDYDSSPGARRRLVHQVPMIGFRPAQEDEPARGDEPAQGEDARS